MKVERPVLGSFVKQFESRIQPPSGPLPRKEQSGDLRSVCLSARTERDAD